MQLAIILAYFALTIGIGLYSQKKSKTSDSFHGAGLGILMCVAAGTGEWLGGTSTTGVSEYGYLFGLSGAWYTVANGLGILVLAIFFAKLYRSLDTVTVPGILGHYLGKNARLVASLMLIFVMIVVGASQIIAAGTLGVSILGLDFNVAVIILGLCFIVYTIAGGMNAVGRTNILHLVAMYGGILVALAVVGAEIGGLGTLTRDLPADPYFQPMGIGTSKASSWIIASVLGACTAQAGIQPLLAAKDIKTARRAAFITALIVAPFGILTALLGMSARILYPSLENPKLALPTLMMDMHPVVGGIVLASIFAAVLSTISPIILAAGTMFTKDIFQRFCRWDVPDHQLLRMSRISTGAAGLICIALAIGFYGSTRILDMVYFAYTLRGALFIVLMYGIYCRRASETGAILSMLLTGAVGLFWVAYKAVVGIFPIADWMTETYAAVITAAVATILFSLLFPDKPGARLANPTPRP